MLKDFYKKVFHGLPGARIGKFIVYEAEFFVVGLGIGEGVLSIAVGMDMPVDF